jgi:hypothetical protein
MVGFADVGRAIGSSGSLLPFGGLQATEAV